MAVTLDCLQAESGYRRGLGSAQGFDDGSPYYYNTETEESLWEMPEQVRTALANAASGENENELCAHATLQCTLENREWG